MWSASVLFLAVVVAAAPQVNYPFNSQVPPIAYVGETFSFQFASTTFEPQSENLQYSLTGNPFWLSLDGPSRTLSGTPGPNDAGSKTFTITAAGAAGAVANMQATLIVADSEGLSANANVSEVLSKAGQLSGPSSLALSASQPFDIGFPSDAFTGTGKPLSYYATLSDHTPLPSWIAFDGGSLQFSGTTPQLSTSPQTFNIVLIASDVSNYAGAWINFTLTVSNHKLLFTPWEQNVELPMGIPISFTSLPSDLTLDGNQVSDGELQSVQAEAPSWLSFDSHLFTFTGTPPAGLMSQDVIVVAKDTFGDIANATIHFSFVSPMFNGEIGSLNATVGKEFNHTLNRSILGQQDEVTSVDFGNAAKWLSYDAPTLTIHGKIPTDTTPQDIQATFTAKSEDGSALDSQMFNIHISAAEATDPGVPANAAPGPNNSAAEHSHQSISKKSAIIIGAVIGGVSLLLAILIFAILYCRRGRQKTPANSPRPEISRPMMHSDEWEDIEPSPERDLEKGEVQEFRERTPENVPKLLLDIPSTSPKHRSIISNGGSSIGDGEAKILEEFDRSSWGYREEMGSSHNPHDSMKIPTEMARVSRGMSQRSNSPTKRRCRTTPVYRESYRSDGLPINRRLTGLGHGYKTYCPSRSTGSWSAFRRPRNCASCSSYSTRSTSMLSATPSAFPLPPLSRHTTQCVTSTDGRRSIRVVSGTGDSLPDRRTLDERRQSYIRKRASNLSPFFAAGSSRASSSSYKPPVLTADERPRSHVDAVTSSSVIVKPSEPIYSKERRDFPGSLRTQSASTPLASGSTRDNFPGSLRKQPAHRSFAPTSSIDPSGRVQKPYERPNTWRRGIPEGFPRPVSRSTTRDTLRDHGTDYSLGSFKSSKIFEDAEMSESVYSVDSLDDNVSGEKETQFVLPPLQINHARKSKRESRLSNRTSRALMSEFEHGGKENRYSGPSGSASNAPIRSTVDKGKAKAIPAASPERSFNGHRQSHTTRHSKRSTQIRHRLSPSRPQSRHSQTSDSHSHTRKPSTSTTKSTKSHKRDPSRPQSSAYPYFEAPVVPLPLHAPHESASARPKSKSKSRERHSKRTTRREQTPASLLSHDTSGDVLNYAAQDSSGFEELDSHRSVGLYTRSSQPATAQGRPRTANTSSGFMSVGGGDSPTVGFGGLGIGGLELHDYDNENADGGKGKRAERERERTPLGKIAGVNVSKESPAKDRVRVMEGKGKRPVSVEVKEERGRRGWGSLRAVMRGSGSEAFL